MKSNYFRQLFQGHKALRMGFLGFILLMIFTACDRSSSPEGRMSIKIENLQKEMIDSLKMQNRAILDSLGKIRQDLRNLQQQKK